MPSIRLPRPVRRRLVATAFALSAFAVTAGTASADVGRLAFVQDDGTLSIGGRTVHLHGIYIPKTARTCRTRIRPTRCAPRAVLALEFKIQGFVYCDEVLRYADGSVSAVCRVHSNDPTYGPREDLAAYLLRQGWAVALPGAPIEYVILERIARARERGIWGFQADSILVR